VRLATEDQEKSTLKPLSDTAYLPFFQFFQGQPAFLACRSRRQCLRAVMVCLVLFSVFVGAMASIAYGQSEPNATRNLSSQGLRLKGIRVVPYSRPRPGRYFTFGVNVENIANEEQAGLVVARIEGAIGYEAATEVHVQAGRSYGVDLHMRVPEDFALGSNFEINVSLNSLGANQPVLLNPAGQPMIDSLRLSVPDKTMVTAILLEDDPPVSPEWYWPQNESLMSYELISATNADSYEPCQLLTIYDEKLPSQMVEWDSVDAVVIGREGPMRDETAMASMAQWLAAGGRAWIMFDAINEANLDSILPDGMTCQYIDKVDLTDFTVEIQSAFSTPESERTVRVDEPVSMRRVIQTGGTVAVSINDFPAAIWYKVGKGRLLVTTLDARGWMIPRNKALADLENNPSFQPQSWTKRLYDQLYDIRELSSPMEKAEVLYTLKHIGNPILNRSFVLTLVFGFCAALGIAGGICWCSEKWSRLGWLVPLLSLAASTPLLIASYRLQREVPDTSAHLQIIEALPGSRCIQGIEWTTTYKAGSDLAKLSADGDAITTWPQSSQQSDLRRLTWNDRNRWLLSSSAWPGGLWQLQTRFNVPPQRLDVNATLDRQGLSIQMPSEWTQSLEDSVLMYHPGDPAICSRIQAGATFRVPNGNATMDQSWLGDAIVNDEQARRDEVYRQLPARGSEFAYPSYPALMGWTPLWPSPVSWSDGRNERGAALVILPVNLQPVATGEEVMVPHTVIKLEAPNQTSTIFSNLSGLWPNETTLQVAVPIRFILPKQVCPIKATELTFDLQLRAPQRDVRIVSQAPNAAKPIADLHSPLGAMRIRTSDPAVLLDAEDGSLDFTIDIGGALNDATGAVGIWQIDYVRLSVTGIVLDR